jgi:histidine phosphotransferase ChpT
LATFIGLMVDPLHLTQALCTRLCHDLAGPIGAVSAGVELVGGDPSQVDAETLQLIANSSAAASQKLKFLRTAMGTPPGNSALGDFKATVTGYLSAVAGLSGPASLKWSADHELSAAVTKLGSSGLQVLANMIIMAIEVVPRLSAVSVIAQFPGLAVEAHGEISARLDPRRDLAAVLENPDAVGLTPKTVQPLYTLSLVSHVHGKLTLMPLEQGCRISLAI